MDRQTKRTSTAPKLVLEPVRENSRLESHPLAAGRFMIGSSPECDIVIAMGGVAPQHCLMIVGANKTIVKAISPLTWINDGPLTEAVLKHGERLILGPVELRTRRPEVSEWIERCEPDAAPPAVEATYQPPQIEELLDHARQQLQTVIDEPTFPPETWSDELSLADAVQLHSAAAEPAPPAPAPEREQLVAAQRELQQQELELGERSRALDYLGTELSSREEQLRSRERTLDARQSQVEQWLTEFEQREQTLTAQEQALQVRDEAEATASRMIAQMTQSLEGEQQHLRQREQSIRQQASELEQQALALAERTQALQSQETELQARAESLSQQAQAAQAVQAFAAVRPADTSAVELRETAVAQREAMLSSSLAALQSTREQISHEATELEQRFTELLQREQSLQRRESTLGEQASQAEARIREATALSSAHTEREQAVAATLALVTERETTLQQQRIEMNSRERELRGLRSELDIREESLNQQFSQLQLDRSALRTAQSKLQLAEQSANQRLADLDWSTQQRTNERDADLEQRREELAAQAAEWEAKAGEMQEQIAIFEARQHELGSLAQGLADREQALANTARELTELEQLLTEQQRQFEQTQTTALSIQTHLSDPPSPTVDRTAIDNEWQSLAAERARMASERRELDDALATVRAGTPDTRDTEFETTEVSSQLLALVSERQSLAQQREELLQEQRELRAEREEIRRSHVQLDQDREQLLAIKAESSTERDTYLLERQELISDRQSLRDRERQIQQAETEIEQLRLAAAQTHTEAETAKHQMATQRVHLDEEWASLRQERAEHKQSQAELDTTRDELTLLAQQLSDMQAESEASHSKSVVTIHAPPLPVIQETPVARVESVETPASSESDEISAKQLSSMEPVDPLAGFASFSSIEAEVDADLPPEIAALLRKSGNPEISPEAPGPDTSTSVPISRGSSLEYSVIDNKEEQRLLDLLGRSSESFVDAALANVGVETETYEVVDDEVETNAALASEWDGDVSDRESGSPADDRLGRDRAERDRDQPYSSHDATDRPAPPPEPTAAATELRSRLSDMFGIDLGRLRQPSPQPTEDVQPAPEESFAEEQARLDRDSESDQEEQLVEEEQAPEPESKIDEALDPVAAYMEQLLARTRKTRDSGQAKAEPVAPKPAPPVTVLEEPRVPLITPPDPEPIPVRQPRKTEAVDKQAMRANLDSFRSIANTRARSDVARSELRRLKITEKLKQIFLAISAGITLILISTELWTTRRYRMEMTAALLATAFLGWDYYRTQRRLRELESIAPPELDIPDDEDESTGA